MRGEHPPWHMRVGPKARTLPKKGKIMDDSITEGVSRRRLIGGMTALAGISGAAMLLSPEAAHAEVGQSEGGGHPNAVPTPVQPALRYAYFSGYDFDTLTSTQAYSANGGSFHFLAGSSGYARLSMQLPAGAVIREVEVYGSNTAGQVDSRLWVVDSTTGVISNPNTVSTSAAGPFTLTYAANAPVTATSVPKVFVSLPNENVLISGCRVGYTAPSTFVPYANPNPRVYDTRFGGLTKLAPNEERIVSLGLPPGVGAAVLTLTLSGTEPGGGYVAVFNADTPTWPGNSSVNWSAAGQDIANTVVTQVSVDGRIKIRGGANKTNVIIDVVGHIV